MRRSLSVSLLLLVVVGTFTVGAAIEYQTGPVSDAAHRRASGGDESVPLTFDDDEFESLPGVFKGIPEDKVHAVDSDGRSGARSGGGGIEAPLFPRGPGGAAAVAAAITAASVSDNSQNIQLIVTSLILFITGVVSSLSIANNARPVPGAIVTDRARQSLWLHRQYWTCIILSVVLYAVATFARHAIELVWITSHPRGSLTAAEYALVNRLSDTHLLSTLRRLCITSEAFARCFVSVGIAIGVICFHSARLPPASDAGPAASSDARAGLSVIAFGLTGLFSAILLGVVVVTNDTIYYRFGYAAAIGVVASSLFLGRKRTVARNAAAAEAAVRANPTAPPNESALAAAATGILSGWVGGLRWIIVAISWAVFGAYFPLTVPTAFLEEVLSALCINHLSVSYMLVLLARACVEHAQSLHPTLLSQLDQTDTDTGPAAESKTGNGKSQKAKKT